MPIFLKAVSFNYLIHVICVMDYIILRYLITQMYPLNNLRAFVSI